MSITIPGPVGALEAQVWEPESEGSTWVSVCHPHPQMGGSMYNNVVDALVAAGRQAGCGVVAFNFRGVGDSEGWFDNGQGEADDLLAVVQWIQDEYACPVTRQICAGYSFGAAVMGSTVPGRVDPAAVLFVAFPLQMVEVSIALRQWAGPKHLIASRNDTVCPVEEAEALAGESFGVDILDGGGHMLAGFEAELTNSAATFFSGVASTCGG